MAAYDGIYSVLYCSILDSIYGHDSVLHCIIFDSIYCAIYGDDSVLYCSILDSIYGYDSVLYSINYRDYNLFKYLIKFNPLYMK